MPATPMNLDLGDPGRNRWPGERLGLPERGRGSVARAGRRIVGICIDWGIAVLVSWAFLAYDATATLAIFAVMQYVLVITLGGSIGHVVLGMRVRPLGGGYVSLWRPALRTVLVCLVVPAVVWNADQRGLHDVFSGTVLVRTS
ncbi:RDD family protein [Clavibacter sp. Sh2088]|uniref:RDD family protein n=1 Tax=Clavibacter sp. Sh2088 TaxID=3397676 RepID=UPI0039DFB766